MAMSWALSSTQGFHTTISARISINSPPAATCSLHLSLQLPVHLFVDPYELDRYSASYSFQISGPSNLEAPVFIVDSSDTTLLLNITLTDHGGNGQIAVIDVPLHSRYGRPLRGHATGIHNIVMTAPTVFWACNDLGESCKSCHDYHLHLFRAATPLIAKVPADLPPSIRPYFTGAAVSFIPIPAEKSTPLSQTIRIPVGELQDLQRVEIITALGVFFAFAWLFHAAWRNARRPPFDEVLSSSKKD